MAWVKMIEPKAATGLLKEIYESAKKRAGYVPNITKLQSLRPETMDIGFALYRQLMDAPTGISRRQRVLIATVVSRINGCYW
jgi:alkylhydroperoxidase family enzyme